MKRLMWTLPVGVLLSGCVTAADLNASIEDEINKDPGAQVSLPADPCPGARAADPSGGARSLSAMPGGARAGGANANLELGVALIAASASDGRDGAGLGAYIRSVETSLDFDLAQFAPVLDRLDPGGATAARRVAASPGYQNLEKLYTTDTGARSDGGATTEISLNRRDWINTLQGISDATNKDGWTADFAEELGKFVNDEQGARSEQDRGKAFESLQKKYLLAAYMTAYFRNGHVFRLDFNQGALKDAVSKELKDQVAALAKKASGGITADDTKKAQEAVQEQVDKLLAKYAEALCAGGKADGSACVVFGVIGEQTFVTRAGKSYGFPGVTATIDPFSEKKISTNKINAEDVVIDLVRVIVEAGGDAAFKVPGAKNSTLCGFADGLCAKDADAAKLKKVNDAGDRAEAGATVAIGAAIRGGWLVSLNNETVAKSITAALAVGSRKTAEGVVWKAQNTCPAARSIDSEKYRSVRVRFVEPGASGSSSDTAKKRGLFRAS